jgi:hypothetical protein
VAQSVHQRQARPARVLHDHDAVEAVADCVVQGQAETPFLSGTSVARLAGVHTATLRSMACLRRMLLVAPAQGGPAGAVFPRLTSLRLHLVGCACMHAACTPHLPCKHHARLI